MSVWDWTLMGCLMALFVVQVYFYARYMAAPARKLRKDQKSSITNHKSEIINHQSKIPGVSVILCAHNEGYNLSNYLQALLSQDYPTYEVIVVNDGSEDNTRDVIDEYMLRDARLHTTFVPRGARVRSTKKLGLTLAAKAAQYDYLLLTDADCVPESNQWIREMMNGFFQHSTFNIQHSINIVLGFGAYFYEPGHINRLVRYDTLFNSLHYLGAAICGHPYMGVGRNLAYRKSLFFESGGFTRLMDNRAGDDDLFVNHVATSQNTAVVLKRESYTWSPAKTSLRDWLQQKRRHVSVSPAYRNETKWRLTLEPVTRGLFYLLVLAIFLSSFHPFTLSSFHPFTLSPIHPFTPSTLHPLTLIIAALLFLTRWILQTAIINTSARRMGLHCFSMFTILWLDIILPLISLWMLIIPTKKLKW